MFVVKEPPPVHDVKTPPDIVSQKTPLKKLPPSPKQITFLTTVPRKSSTFLRKMPPTKTTQSTDPEYNPRTTCRRKITPIKFLHLCNFQSV